MQKVLEKMEKSPRKPWEVLEFESVFLVKTTIKAISFLTVLFYLVPLTGKILL